MHVPQLVDDPDVPYRLRGGEQRPQATPALRRPGEQGDARYRGRSSRRPARATGRTARRAAAPAPGRRPATRRSVPTGYAELSSTSGVTGSRPGTATRTANSPGVRLDHTGHDPRGVLLPVDRGLPPEHDHTRHPCGQQHRGAQREGRHTDPGEGVRRGRLPACHDDCRAPPPCRPAERGSPIRCRSRVERRSAPARRQHRHHHEDPRRQGPPRRPGFEHRPAQRGGRRRPCCSPAVRVRHRGGRQQARRAATTLPAAGCTARRASTAARPR